MPRMKTNRLLAPRIDADNPHHAPRLRFGPFTLPNRHTTIHEPSRHRSSPGTQGHASALPCPPRTCGEALVDLLERHGVECVFGIPGVHTVEFLSRPRRVVDPPRDAAPRTGAGFGRRLCTRHGPAGRLLHHHRAGDDQYRDRDGTGLCGFDPDAGDLERQRETRTRPRRRPPARAAVAARRVRGTHRVLAHAARRGRPAAGPRARLRGLRQRAAAARAYRDSARRDRDAGARAVRRPAALPARPRRMRTRSPRPPACSRTRAGR